MMRVAPFFTCKGIQHEFARVRTNGKETTLTVKKMKKKFHERRNFIVKKLNNIDNITCQMPGGAFYVFPDFSYFIGKNLNGKTISSASDIALGLLSTYYVVSVGGNSFGSDNNIRFSYALSKDDLDRAVNLLEKFLKKIN